ncbi:MAG TPA: radical SAM protein [Elusimicrobiota bacterium]|nr:radical SAM protein [Elusimicrobiota bacterium]
MTPAAPESLTLGLTGVSLSLVVSPQATLTFDFSGRPIGLYQNGSYYAFGLDGRAIEKKWRPEDAERRKRYLRLLSTDESRRLRERLVDILHACEERLPELQAGKRLQLWFNGKRGVATARRAGRVLRHLLAFNTVRWRTDAEQFRKLYPALGILPPDQYLALVVQVTEGCFWKRCAFCVFRPETPARVKSRDEILRHIDAVRGYWGRALPRRCSIFLGDANAFDAPPDLLLWTCRTLAEIFPRLAVPQKDGFGGLYAFGEIASLSTWEDADLAEISRSGLRRVYLGLESGSDTLRRWSGKPGTARQALETVRRLKNAGLDVGLIFLLGLGGRENGREHVETSARFLREAPLGRRDIVYFSPLREDFSSEHGPRLKENRWTNLSEEGQWDQMLELRRPLDERPPTERPMCGLYDIREFLY